MLLLQKAGFFENQITSAFPTFLFTSTTLVVSTYCDGSGVWDFDEMRFVVKHLSWMTVNLPWQRSTPVRRTVHRLTCTRSHFTIRASKLDGKGWLGSRVVSVLDSGAEGPGFESQSLRCRVTVLGKLLTAIVLLFTNQQNW